MITDCQEPDICEEETCFSFPPNKQIIIDMRTAGLTDEQIAHELERRKDADNKLEQTTQSYPR